MAISDAFVGKVRMKIKVKTPAFIAALQANTGHLLWLCALSGQKMVAQKTFFFQSPLKSYFKSLDPGSARQGMIAVSHPQVGMGAGEDQATCVTPQHDLVFESSGYR